MPEIVRKICLIGDPAVGKTSLINQFVYNRYEERYLSTMGTRISKKKVRVEVNGETYSVTLMIWDILGQKEFRILQESAFKGSAGAIGVYDVTRENTYKNLKTWLTALKNITGDIPVVIAGNKTDLGPQFNPGEGEIITTSAKTGENVEEVFVKVATAIVKNTGGT